MPRNWITIIVITLVIVVAWVALEVFFAFTGKEVEVDYTQYLTPIESTIDEVTIQDINQRKQEFLPVKIEDLE